MTVVDRNLKYNAAGRQVEIFDPALYSCCEVNRTYKTYYDGDGRQVKLENLSTAGDITTYEIRSTVLGGEKVGETDGLSMQNFIAPVLGGELTHTSAETAPRAIYTREAPEEYGYDPMGAPVGDEPGTSFTGGGGQSYPGFPDADNPNRCSWERLPTTCEMKERLSNNAGRIEVLVKAQSEAKEKNDPELGPPHPSPGPKSETSKPGADGESGGQIYPSSLPCVDYQIGDFINICVNDTPYDLGDSARRNLVGDDDVARGGVDLCAQHRKAIFGQYLSALNKAWDESGYKGPNRQVQNGNLPRREQPGLLGSVTDKLQATDAGIVDLRVEVPPGTDEHKGPGANQIVSAIFFAKNPVSFKNAPKYLNFAYWRTTLNRRHYSPPLWFSTLL